MIISTFKNITSVKDPVNQDINKVLESFKTDVRGIKKMQDDKTIAEKKKELPYACFNGVFEYRSSNGLIQSSGIMTIDIDKVDVQLVKNKFKNKEWVYSMFTSPSGNGVKILVKIPIVKNDKEYKEYYSAFEEEFKEVDASGKDISRACFYSYDPDIYINTNCKEWTKKKDEVISFKKINNVKTDYSIANRVLNIIRNAIEGERHNKVLKASILMGGYVASKKVIYEEAIRLLEQEAYAIDPSDFRTNKKAIIDGLENGMQKPIFDDHKELEKEEIEFKHGKIYYTLNDKRNEIDELYLNGVVKGYELSFNNSKGIISVKMGCSTYIYGSPASGKSQFWFEYLIDLSVNHGLRHAIFSPETGKASDIFIELMTIYIRKDFYKDFNNQMSEKEKDQASKFIDAHFIVIDPDDEVFTIEEFYDYVDIVERVYNCKIHTTVADPFNEFSHDFSKDNGRQDMYIERVLGYIRRNARTNNRHNCIITHVVDQKQITKDGVSFYPPATYREIAGGQAWSRKGEQMICVWRPNKELKDNNGMPYEPNQTVVIVQKSKPKGVGKVGNIDLFYDIKKHSYYEISIDGEMVYPDRIKKIVEAEKKYFDIEINENGYPAMWD